MTPLTLLRRRGRSLTTAAVVALIFLAGYAFGTQATVGRAQSADSLPPEAQTILKPIWEAYAVIQDRYVDPLGKPVEPAQLIDAAINGMARALGDRYSYYVPPQNVQAFADNVQGEFVGIGAVVNTNPDNGDIRVVEVLVGSPSEQAGLQVGDVFVTFDGIDVRTITRQDLVARAKGPEGSEVQVTVRRGEELIDMTITRARLVKPNTDVHVINQNIGYVKLKQFSPRAPDEIAAALTNMNADTLGGLILDLRGNAGGQLGSLVGVASAFISDGVILTEQFSQDRQQVFNTNGSFGGLTVPMVVLVDHTSMSAAEALTGALQDHDRATVVGVQTFGKGTAQSVAALSNGGALRLTIARWLTPDNHWIHLNGITPDIVVPAIEGSDDVQLRAAVDFLQAQIDAGQPVAN